MMLPRILLAMALTSVAPFQCAGDPDPDKAREESPGEALYKLAEKFKTEGDERARRRTLKYLVERSPSSRFAKMAEEDLGEGD